MAKILGIHRPLTNKNYIINGALDFWQRGTSFAAIADGTYSADRWGYRKGGAAVHTLSRSTDVPTASQAGYVFPYSIRLNLTTPDNSTPSCRLEYRLEGGMISPLHERNMTLSFWVKAVQTGIYHVVFRNATNTRYYTTNYTINSSNTWEKKSVSLKWELGAAVWETGVNQGLQVNFIIAGAGTDVQNTWTDGFSSLSGAGQVNGVQTGATDFYITGVKLEEGTEATEFERAGGTVGQELALCQRYFEKSYNIGDTPGTNTTANRHLVTARAISATATSSVIGATFKVQKRSNSPVMTSYAPEGTINNLTVNTEAGVGVAAGFQRQSEYSFCIGTSATSGLTVNNAVQLAFHWTASAEL